MNERIKELMTEAGYFSSGIIYNVYYLAEPTAIVAGPFPTVDAAVMGKDKFIAPYASLLKVVKSTIRAELV